MLHTVFPEFEPGGFIHPGCPTLLQVLEPNPMVGLYHCPPKSLTILHHLLLVNSHFAPDDIRLKGHD